VIFDFAKREAVYEDRSVEAKSAGNWPPAFSPKSNVLAYTLERGLATLELRDGGWKSGRKVDLPFKITIPFPNPRTLAWSDDGSTVVLAEHEGSRRIDLTTGEAAPLDFGKSDPRWVSFPGPNLAVGLCTAGRYETVMMAGGSVAERIPGVRILAMSGDRGSWLVAVGGGCGETIERTTAVEVWDAKTRKPRARIEVDPESTFSAFTGVCQGAFSADGTILVTGDFRVVDIRDGRTGAILHTIRHYDGDRVVALAISPDGRHLLTMGRPTNHEDDGVVLWQLSFE
jgi:WD40 repeat protein